MTDKQDLFEEDQQPQKPSKAKPKLDPNEHHHQPADHKTIYDPMCPKCQADDEARKAKATMTREEVERTLFFVPRDNPEMSICSDYIASRYPAKTHGQVLCKSFVRYDKLGNHKDLQIVLVRRIPDEFGCLPSAFREVPNSNPGMIPALRPRPHAELFPQCLESAPVRIADYMDFRVSALYGRENDTTGPHRLAQALQDICGGFYRIDVPPVYNVSDQKLIFRCA